MNRLFTRENALERERRRAVAAGELRDVTREAREHGLIRSVAISNRLWTGLMRPYPFAEPSDCLTLAALICALKHLLRTAPSTNVGMLFVPPSDLPAWFRTPCYLRFLFIPSQSGPDSVVIRAHAEHPYRRPKHWEAALPATLLVRLAETLKGLMLVSPAAEQGLLDSMDKIATQMISAHPFQSEILAHVAAITPDFIPPAPPQISRSALLADLDEFLAILSHCADVRTRPNIEALKSHYRALVSPLAAFREILEDLLRFTISGSNPGAPWQGQPFSYLLHLHADSHARLQRLETVVPSAALAVVRFQLRLLALAHNPDARQFLADIDRQCASLLDKRWLHEAHGPSRECRQAVVWH